MMDAMMGMDPAAVPPGAQVPDVDGAPMMATPSTDPQTIVAALIQMAQSDQQQLAMQQAMEQQGLAQEQQAAIMGALQMFVQQMGAGAHMPAGPEAAAPMPDEAMMAAQPPMAGDMAGAMPSAGQPVYDPDDIPPNYG